MTQVVKAPTELALDWVRDSIFAAADALELSASNHPELEQRTFKGGESAVAAKLEVVDLPTSVRAIRIGRYTLLLGILPAVPSLEAINEALRRFRNQCVVARSYLTSNGALDLQLFLIGPRGSQQSEDWKTLALLIERDDRVARKLVWLRPQDPSDDENSFAKFLKRTFLARPWSQKKIFTMAELDSLSNVLSLEKMPRDSVGEWVRLAFDKDADPELLVDALINAWAKENRP